MKITSYAVKNYQFTLVIFLMVIALGVNALLNMPRAEDPEMNVPFFPVLVIYPGASPEDLEELVINPLERKISELEDIDKIISSARDGLAFIRVDFKHGSNVEIKYQDLVREVNSTKGELPPDIYDMYVEKVLPSNVSILQIALISENATHQQVTEYAEDLQDMLETIPELKLVEIHGLPRKIVRVELQLEKMARMGITSASVINLLKSEMASIPGGSLEAGTKVFNVKTSGNFKSADDVANTLVYSAGGQTFRLKDIADVYYDRAEEKHIARLNGYQCVLLTAAQKEGNNIALTQEKYTPVLEEFRKTLPANIEMVKHFDQADNVNNRLSRLGFEFLIAILLVSITLLPLGFRAAFIVMVSIPLSLAIGLVLLDLLGYTLNQLSIVGLVVALGLLVDDSIVVVENIERWLRDGFSKKDAAIKATQQIGLAVVGCTATLVIAFLPLVYLPEASGDFIRSLPMAVILTVLASMAVSLTIIPFLSSMLLKQHEGSRKGIYSCKRFKKPFRRHMRHCSIRR
jgi:multidrug efflux pump subunit AcrB